MQTISSPSKVQTAVDAQRCNGSTVGVVPTMGALHAGHVSLIDAARRDCDFVVTTIFVNPTQFGPDEDFDCYPRTLERDLDLCRQAGVDLVFVPETSSMYPEDSQTVVQVTRLTQMLEGAKRPTHFQGVTTVVAKLLHITVPHRAYFGQKDYQQQLVIRRMVTDLNWPVEIVTCPIVREHDGLALSSRNRYLSPEERTRALILSDTLKLAAGLAAEGVEWQEIESRMQQKLAAADGVSTDYAVVRDVETLEAPAPTASTAVALLAARVGSTRLIDNEILQFG